MPKPAISILLPPLLLLLVFNAPAPAQTETPEAEPPALIQPAPPPVLAEPPAQMEVEQPAPEPPATTPALTAEAEETPPDIEPPASAQPAVTRPETPPFPARSPEPEQPAPFSEVVHFEPEPRTLPPPHSSAFVLPAGFVSYSVRNGYRKYDGVDGYQRVAGNGMFTYGGAFGKRFALKNRRVRFQAAAEAQWGAANEDSYDYGDDNSAEGVHEYINISTVGITADMQVLFFGDTRAYFLSVGPGLHRSSFSFSLKRNNGQVLWKSENMSMASPSLNIGAGLEYTVNETRAVSLIYNFRIWNPVHYMETGDLFPMGVQYEEFFYTHSFNIQLLLPGTKKGTFQ